MSCTAETYAVLAQHPNIVGVKEASGSFALIQETLNLCGDGFSVWSGNDEDTAAVCALGGAGVISVAANIVPCEMHRLVELCLADRILEAGREQLRLAPLIRALFCEVILSGCPAGARKGHISIFAMRLHSKKGRLSRPFSYSIFSSSATACAAMPSPSPVKPSPSSVVALTLTQEVSSASARARFSRIRSR